MKISLDLFYLCIHPQIFFPTLYVLFPDSTVSNIRKYLRQAKAALKRPKKGGHLGPFRTTNSTHAKREEEEERGLDIEHKGEEGPFAFLRGRRERRGEQPRLRRPQESVPGSGGGTLKVMGVWASQFLSSIPHSQFTCRIDKLRAKQC